MEAGMEQVREWGGDWYKESQKEQVRAKLSDGFHCLSKKIQGLQHDFEGPLGFGFRPLHLSPLPADIPWRQPKLHEGPQKLHALYIGQAS